MSKLGVSNISNVLQALAEFMTEIRGNKVKFDPQKLVFCIAEHGDAFLLPTPYYPG